MKKELMILIIPLLLIACSSNNQSSKILNAQHKLLKELKSYKQNDLKKLYKINKMKTKPFYDRALVLNYLTDTIISQLNNLDESTFESFRKELSNCFLQCEALVPDNLRLEIKSSLSHLYIDELSYDEVVSSKEIIRNNILILELNILNCLFDDLRAYDYEFDAVKPVIITRINDKEHVVAEVFLSSWETTEKYNLILIEDYSKEGKLINPYDTIGQLDGRWVINILTGINEIKGVIQGRFNIWGGLDNLYFEHKFE